MACKGVLMTLKLSQLTPSKPMRDLFFPVALLPFLATASTEDLSFWEKLLEKWGIGLVGMACFYLLAKWTARREDVAKEEQKTREDSAQAERVSLLQTNNELAQKLLTQSEKHASTMEKLVKDHTKSASDNAVELRNLTRKMKRPCVMEDLQSLETNRNE